MASPYPSISGNVIAQITNKGRSLVTRTSIEGLSYKLIGWAMGREGYNPLNVVEQALIDPALTVLIDQIYPITGINLFNTTDLEMIFSRSVVATCRIPLNASGANYGIGELGIWCEIKNSTIPSEIGERHLFAVAHTPIQVITLNTQKSWRIIINY